MNKPTIDEQIAKAEAIVNTWPDEVKTATEYHYVNGIKLTKEEYYARAEAEFESSWPDNDN